MDEQQQAVNIAPQKLPVRRPVQPRYVMTREDDGISSHAPVERNVGPSDTIVRSVAPIQAMPPCHIHHHISAPVNAASDPQWYPCGSSQGGGRNSFLRQRDELRANGYINWGSRDGNDYATQPNNGNWSREPLRYLHRSAQVHYEDGVRRSMYDGSGSAVYSPVHQRYGMHHAAGYRMHHVSGPCDTQQNYGNWGRPHNEGPAGMRINPHASPLQQFRPRGQIQKGASSSAPPHICDDDSFMYDHNDEWMQQSDALYEPPEIPPGYFTTTSRTTYTPTQDEMDADGEEQRIRVRKQQQVKRGPRQRKPRTPSVLLPNRDPLLHSSVLTPPVPVIQDDLRTPSDAPTYTHRPDLPDYLLPKINMQFNTTDEAFSFYNRYARHAGFGLRKGQNDGRRSYLYCSRQGTHKFGGHETERIRDKTTKRTGCLARLRLKVRNDGTCFIADVTYDHNHQLDLSASMVVFLRSHKNFDPHEMQLVERLQKSNAPHGSIMSFLASMHGGHHNLPYNSRDIHNRKAENVRKATEHDVFRLLAFFHEMKSVNENFFYEIKIDETESISHIFWANASCRGAYEDLNDCVTFDTTYKTNKFRMPLGVFVGVNNHLQSTIFAIALMRDETIESFQWVFSRFLRCMNSKHPICILTDQCPSMAEAIPTVFPDTLHRLCRWHVVKKYRDDPVKIYAQQPAFKDELHSILNWPLMPTEFEDAWAGLMNKYSLQEDEAMEKLYSERARWVSAYFKDVFCARMTSTQRSESMNNVIKKSFVSESTCLNDFAKQLNNCIHTRRELENSAINANKGAPSCRSFYSFEVGLSKIYTKAVYALYKESSRKATCFTIKEDPEGPHRYLVAHKKQDKEFAWSKHSFRVYADAENGKYECECKLWDHTGLFCTHIVKVLERLQPDRIPAKYILKRYTRGARAGGTFDRQDYNATVADGSSAQYRHSIMVTLLMNLARKSMLSEAIYNMLYKGMCELDEKADAMHSSETPNRADPMQDAAHVDYEVPEYITRPTSINPPPVSANKGRKKTEAGAVSQKARQSNAGGQSSAQARWRPPPELDKNGKPLGVRLCSGCNKISGHNIRTCPVVLANKNGGKHPPHENEDSEADGKTDSKSDELTIEEPDDADNTPPRGPAPRTSLPPQAPATRRSGRLANKKRERDDSEEVEDDSPNDA